MLAVWLPCFGQRDNNGSDTEGDLKSLWALSPQLGMRVIQSTAVSPAYRSLELKLLQTINYQLAADVERASQGAAFQPRLLKTMQQRGALLE